MVHADPIGFRRHEQKPFNVSRSAGLGNPGPIHRHGIPFETRLVPNRTYSGRFRSRFDPVPSEAFAPRWSAGPNRRFAGPNRRFGVIRKTRENKKKKNKKNTLRGVRTPRVHTHIYITYNAYVSANEGPTKGRRKRRRWRRVPARERE